MTVEVIYENQQKKICEQNEKSIEAEKMGQTQELVTY